MGILCLLAFTLSVQAQSTGLLPLNSPAQPSGSVSDFTISPALFRTIAEGHTMADLTSRLPISLDQLTVDDLPRSCTSLSGLDKRRHFVISFSLTTGMYVVLHKGALLSKRNSILVSLATGTTVGLLKEVYDSKHGSPACFSRGDMIANGLGMLAATGFVLMF